MSSSMEDELRAKRAATLNDLRFKRNAANKPSTLSTFNGATPSSSSSSSSLVSTQPAQSRDGSLSSRYFPPQHGSPIGRVLVPSSSPLNSPPNQSQKHARGGDVASNESVPRGGPWSLSNKGHGFEFDPSTSTSGFISSSSRVAVRSFTGSPDEGPPRKRQNRGPDDSAFSPGVQLAGQRRRHVAEHADSSEESMSESLSAKPRIVRRHAESSAEAPSTTPSEDVFGDEKFTRFKLTMPTEPPHRVKAAWLRANFDVKIATALLSDPNWIPQPVVNGRVDGFVEANRAHRAAVKEKGKKSAIYANRPQPKPAPPVVTPVRTNTITTTNTSPVMSQPIRKKRNTNLIVDSDSDADSDDDRLAKRTRHEDADALQVLAFFNTKSSEALQSLTGCTAEQADTIIQLRKFESVQDLNTKLGQGKKKAGPSGISPRVFEESVEIFRGYGVVDDVLEDCEQIGAKLRSSIASWTVKGKEKQTLTELEDGALSLRSVETSDHSPKGYLVNQPTLLSSSVKLKDYQLTGVNWLNLLYQNNLSCILADEMGLGKTIQVISFFAHLREQGNKGPHLVVVPSSTLENWCREFARFAPSISVQTYYGGKDERIQLRQTLLDTKRCDSEDDQGWDVLITTYNLAQGDSDRKFFRRIEWDCCVFDEGHVLKNFQSQRYSSLLRVQSKWRLLLTGTPLQNNLQELVSLMNFILPDQFADAIDNLRQIFKVKGDSKVSLLAQERVSRAKKMMTPFVLRRRKDQVLTDLPRKTERIEWCEMTTLQKSIYRDTIQRSRKTVLEADVDSTENGLSNGRGKGPKKVAKSKDKQYLENSTNVLMDLRKAALHPMLFRSRFTDDALTAIAKLLLKEPDFRKRGAVFEMVHEDMSVMTDAELQHFCGTYKSIRKFQQQADCFVDSGKVQMLLKLLAAYKEQDRKILIFSQFTQVLDILEVILKEREINYLVLTGSTPVDVRQSLVDEFTEDDSIAVFLLSTKAGGMGINLTAASVVIMFDQDFNPHNDRQAQDRAYRIGQKRDVEVVKLISRGTIEEDMLKLGEMKLALDEAVAGDDENGDEVKEREMKKSLMSVLRKQFEQEQVVSTDLSIPST